MTKEEEEEEVNENTATNEHPEILEGGGLEMVGVSHNFINPLNKNDKSKRVQINALFMQEAPEPPVPRLKS